MKKLGMRMTECSLPHPAVVTGAVVLLSAFFILAAALPSLFPRQIPWLHGVDVDTDPENMFSRDEAVRVFHVTMRSCAGHGCDANSAIATAPAMMV